MARLIPVSWISVTGCPDLPTDASAESPDASADRSAAMIRPPGPDPLPMDVKSRPCSLATLFANGEANNLPATPLDPCLGTLAAGTLADGAELGFGAGGGAAVSFGFTAIGPLGAT